MEQQQYSEEKSFELQDYLRVLRKRRWTIIAIFFIVALAVAVKTFSAIPIYKSSARIVIEKENPNIVSIAEVMAVDTAGTDYYQTQHRIIESRSVAREVIQRLNLENSVEFFPPPRDDIVSRAKSALREWGQKVADFYKSHIQSLLKTSDGAGKSGSASSQLDADLLDDNEGIDPSLVSAVIKRIDVAPIRNSRLVDVGVEAANPVMAARMANTVVEAYIDQNLETKLQAAKDAVQWLTVRIEEERKKVEEAENALLEYKKNNQIITDFSSDAENITAEKLAWLNEQVVEAESLRVEAETRYRQALALKDNPEMLVSIPEVLANQLIQEIKKMEVDLYNRMSELSKKYGQNHPKMVAIQSELADLKDRKEREARRVLNALRSKYQLALAKERSLKRALEGQKRESLDLNQKAIRYSVLQRQAESAQHMYDMLIKRFKETSLAEEMKTGNIRIIDRAQVPRQPIKPNKKRNLLMGMLVGLMLGVGLAFLLEYMDNTVRFPDELKNHFNIAFLGLIPSFDVRENIQGLRGDLIAAHSPNATPSESFRGVRTGILFSSPDVKPQVILVTSAGPGEGKSLCASNLAITMAQAGSRTLLLDGDLRRPRLHNIFSLEREDGLTSVIVGAKQISEVSQDVGIENLLVVPCGPIPPNPSETLGSQKMLSLLNDLRQEYDRIIIDSPPVSAVTDATLIAREVDGVLMIIRAGVTPRKVIGSAIENLRMVGGNVLGAVLNAVDTKRDSYYYQSYYYYYDSYHGNPEKKKRRNKNAKAA